MPPGSLMMSSRREGEHGPPGTSLVGPRSNITTSTQTSSRRSALSGWGRSFRQSGECPVRRHFRRPGPCHAVGARSRVAGLVPGGRARSVGLHPTAHSAPRAGPRYHAPGSSDPGDREPWVPKPAAYCSPMPASNGPQSLGKADGANPASSLAAMPSGELDSPPRPSPVYRTETPAVFHKPLKIRDKCALHPMAQHLHQNIAPRGA